MAKRPPALISVRFRRLLMQLAKENGGNVAAAGSKLGLAQPHAHALHNGNRNASWATIQEAQKKLPVAATFFTDRTLGDAPNYRDFLPSGVAAEQSPANDSLVPPRAEGLSYSDFNDVAEVRGLDPDTRSTLAAFVDFQIDRGTPVTRLDAEEYADRLVASTRARKRERTPGNKADISKVTAPYRPQKKTT